MTACMGTCSMGYDDKLSLFLLIETETCQDFASAMSTLSTYLVSYLLTYLFTVNQRLTAISGFRNPSSRWKENTCTSISKSMYAVPHCSPRYANPISRCNATMTLTVLGIRVCMASISNERHSLCWGLGGPGVAFCGPWRCWDDWHLFASLHRISRTISVTCWFVGFRCQSRHHFMTHPVYIDNSFLSAASTWEYKTDVAV